MYAENYGVKKNRRREGFPRPGRKRYSKKAV